MAERPALEQEEQLIAASGIAKPERKLPDKPTEDYFLQELVNLANDGVELGVTLTVGGFLLSGTIVGGKRYFDDHLGGAGFTDGLDEESREFFLAFFRSFGKIYDPPQDGTEGQRNPPVFIHLKDARFFHHAGKPIPVNRPIWWRGRISEVQGLSLGTLVQDSD